MPDVGTEQHAQETCRVGWGPQLVWARMRVNDPDIDLSDKWQRVRIARSVPDILMPVWNLVTVHKLIPVT